MPVAAAPADADVVVIGGGLAGLCAGIEAARHGARVLVLEKAAQPGGSSVLSEGFFAFAGTPEQAAAGIRDDDERLTADLLACGGGDADPRLVAVFVARQAETYRWLRSRGIAFGAPQLSAGQSVPRTHPTDPNELFAVLRSELLGMPGTTLLTDAAATRLSRMPCGAATRVAFRHEGRDRIASARRAVVLCSGGFSRDDALVRLFAPRQAKALRCGADTNTGDGLRMAWALGAGLADMGHVKGTFGFHPTARVAEGRGMVRLPIYRGAIAVDRAGRRFCDESLPYKLIGDACLALPDALAWQVFDRRIMQTSTPGVSAFDFAAAQRAGWLNEAQDAASLARAAGIDPDGLVRTLAGYNAGVAAGTDDTFGRRSLGAGFGRPQPIDTAPFYAWPCTSALIATYCGVSIDDSARVLDVYGGPIPRLYAAGEITGGFHGAAYMTGSALGKAIVFGRIAGRAAAEAPALATDCQEPSGSS